MHRNVLITGGAGFIGSRLATALVNRGHRVRVLDSLSPQIHGDSPETSALYQSIRGIVDFRRGSVTNEVDVLASLEDVDTVVHLAAETGTGQSMYAIRHYSDVNVGGTALLLDVIANRKIPVQRLVVASSRAVYGEGKYCCDTHGAVYPASRLAAEMTRGDFDVHCPHCARVVSTLPTDEATPANPTSVYGVTKLTQEQLVLAVGRALGISAIAFRYQNVYGPGQSLSNPYTGILSIFSTRIRYGREINIFEDGKESRDFVFVDDVVEATVAGVEHDEPIVDVFNVGSAAAVTVSEIASRLQTLLGVQVATVVSGQFRVGDIRHNVADIEKIRAVLGWQPRTTVVDGLQSFTAWVKTQPPQRDGYDASLQELRAKGLFQ
jgi:dTDP-L-rhamnose 4-epimerase